MPDKIKWIRKTHCYSDEILMMGKVMTAKKEMRLVIRNPIGKSMFLYSVVLIQSVGPLI